ncbi:MAG: hypothetical protein HY660_06300 [Armatimonadetes bacterium]|nr:hypothetical protein [Armatimonadota bacterium]
MFKKLVPLAVAALIGFAPVGATYAAPAQTTKPAATKPAVKKPATTKKPAMKKPATKKPATVKKPGMKKPTSTKKPAQPGTKK